MSDVAKLAGVSTMTVSRVLNQSPQVTEGLRKRVFAAIEALRYQPNELARSLREQRSRQIGVIVPYLFDPFFAICAHAVSSVVRSHGYSIVLATSNEDPKTEYEEASRMLRRNVEGMIIIPAITGAARSLLLSDEFKRIPIVTLDRPVEGSYYDSLLVDNVGGARTGTEHLLQLGHKRILFLGLTEDLYTMRMRRLGYEQAMQSAQLKSQIVSLSSDQESTRSTLSMLFSKKVRPTALFSANNLLTRHVLHTLQSINMHPPSPVALVGFDDFDTADLLRPGITVVRQPNEQLGRDAAECLFARLRGASVTPVGANHVLPVELIVRGSCGANGT